MVSKLKAAGVDGVIMVTPPPVDDSGGKFSDGSRSNARLKQYADAVISTAKELGLPYVDIFDNFQVGRVAAVFQCRVYVYVLQVWGGSVEAVLPLQGLPYVDIFYKFQVCRLAWERMKCGRALGTA